MEIIGNDIIEQLQQHARLHDLDGVAVEGIRKWLNDPDSHPLPNNLNPNQVKAAFASRWLCFEPKLVSYPYIDTRYDLLHGDSVIGYYRLITLLDGKIDDDYFVFEPNVVSA